MTFSSFFDAQGPVLEMLPHPKNVFFTWVKIDSLPRWNKKGSHVLRLDLVKGKINHIDLVNSKLKLLIWSKESFNQPHWSGQRQNQPHSFSTKTEIHEYFLTSSPKVFFPRQTTKGTSSLSRTFSSCRDGPSLQRYICSSGAWLAQIIIALAQPSKFYQTLKTWPKELAAVGMIVTHPQEDLCAKTWLGNIKKVSNISGDPCLHHNVIILLLGVACYF